MKRKISFEFIAIVLSAFLVFIIGATIIARNSLNRATELNLNQYLEIVKMDADGIESYETLIDDYDQVSNHLRITIIDSTGLVLADSEADELDNHLNRPEIQSLGEVFIRQSDTLDIQMMYLASRLSNGDYIRVAIPTASTASFLNDFIGLSIVIGVIIITLSVIIGHVLIKRSLRPLIDIKNHLIEVGDGQYHEIMPVEKYDEVNDLIKEINKINQIISTQIASLKLEKNKTDFLINHMKQGICVLNESHQIIFLNKYLKDIYKFNIDININKDYRFLFREEEIQRTIDASYKTTSNKQIIIEKDQRYYSISIDYSTDNWRHKPTVIIIYTDITSIKYVEDLKKDFFVNASHELKSPLTSIMGSAELIKEGLVKDKATMIDLSNRIYQESHRMSDLVMDMLKLSEIESQKSIQSKEMIHINQMVDDILNNLGVLIKNQEMTINKDISVKYIEFNPDDFYHMVKNILENAIKYSPKASQVWIRIYKKNERLNIEIKDEGIGIPKADQDRIFERFYRVDKARSRISGGTGLGLSIVKHIVLNAGGHIFVESEENVGTTIHIELKEMTQSPQ
jgi:two-component system phosphate regulon sensor histidine kinase PhoR